MNLIHQTPYDALQDQRHVHLAGQVQYNTQHVRENSQRLRDNEVLLDKLVVKTEKVDGVEKEETLKLRMLQGEVDALKEITTELKSQLEKMQTEIKKIELVTEIDWAPSGKLIGQKFVHLKL